MQFPFRSNIVVSGAVLGHLLLGVSDCALEGLNVVSFGFADDFFDGACHGRFD